MVMGKLPRKEQLLKEQAGESKPAIAATNAEDGEVKKAKDAAEIAVQHNKQMEAEIQVKLREEGYKSLEDGLADAKNKLTEADKILAYAEETKQDIANQLEQLEEEKKKVVNAYAIVKEREVSVNKRLMEAIELENASHTEQNGYKALREDLQSVIEYHRSHIQPCRRALLNVSKAIYNWADVLTGSKVDFIHLYNYIGAMIKEVDKYVDSMPATTKAPEIAEHEETNTASDKFT